MALKSVIDISVEDGDFQRFAAMFNKYKEELAKTPAQWKKVGDEIEEVLDKTVVGVEDVQDATEETSKAATATSVAFRQIFLTVNNQSNAIHNIAQESAIITRNTDRQASAWGSMAQNAGRFTSRVVEATRSLLRWGELTGLISGILGGGGLFGIERLATNAGNQRRNALGLGVSPGEAKAFETDFGRVVDTAPFLSGVNEALHDVTKRVGLYGAGMTEKEMAGKDTAEVGSELLTHLKKIADQTPDAMMGNVLQARKLDQFISLQDFQRLKNTPEAELDQYKKNFKTDTSALDLTRQQARAWQDLQVQLARAGATIETVFIRGLTPLAKPIGDLSAAFTQLVADLLGSKQLKEWIDDLASGIRWLDGQIGSDGFRQGVLSFIKGVDDLAHKAVEFTTNLADLLPSLETIKSFETDFGEGLKTARTAVQAFADAVDTVAKALAGMAHGILDPWTKGTPVTPGDDQGDATGWDRFKSWLNGGRFSGRMGHQPGYDSDPSLSDPASGMVHPMAYRTFAGRGGFGGGGGAFGDIESQNNLPGGLLSAVERQESGGRDLTSPAGAQGYFQFMPATAQRFGVNPHDEMSSARGAGAYLGELMKRFNGDVEKALAGYNWGEKNVEKDVSQYGDRWREHLPAETRNYIRSIGEHGPAPSRPSMVPNGGRPPVVAINITNATGGSAVVSASQLAVG